MVTMPHARLKIKPLDTLMGKLRLCKRTSKKENKENLDTYLLDMSKAYKVEIIAFVWKDELMYCP